MKLDALLKFAKVLPLFGLLIAYGCGSGGSGTTASVPPTMQPGTGTGMQPGTGTGMQPGTGTGMQSARTAPGLGELFSSEPERSYSPTATSLLQRSNTTGISTAPFVSSIERNASGGYDIVYQDGAEQITVKVLPEHCTANDGCIIPADSNGRSHWFWSWTNRDHLGGPSGYEFIEVSGFGANDGSGTVRRAMFVFGVETPASDVPATGEAVYSGRMAARTYRTNEGGTSSRQRYFGQVRLVANFDMSRLTGRVYSIAGTAPGESSSDRVSWPTSSFTITNGQVTDGQFTATLTGMDSDSSVPDVESVRGFVGSIVAKFYGPNAVEFGGKFTATRDLQGTDNDRALHGYVAGTRLGPPSVLGSSAIMVGVNRDYQNQMTESLQDDGNAAVERTDNGWRLTVGGRTFEFSDRDFEANPRFRYNYSRQFSDAYVVMGSFTDGTRKSRQFDHFDVMGWGTAEPGSSPPRNSGQFGLLVYGDRTPASALPSSGTATYSGHMRARDFPTDDAVDSNDPAYRDHRGDATLEADFSNASVAGEFTNLQSRPGDGSYSSVAGGATFNATVSGNSITASDLAGTGALAGYQNGRVRGSFFGPDAEEAAGAFDAQDAANQRAMFGYFGTSKTE